MGCLLGNGSASNKDYKKSKLFEIYNVNMNEFENIVCGQFDLYVYRTLMKFTIG